MRLRDLTCRCGIVFGTALLTACCAPVEEESRHVGWSAPEVRPAPVQSKPVQLKTASATAKPQAVERPAARKAAIAVAIDPKVQQVVAEIAGELSARCSFAGPGDQAAFDDCRKAIGGGSKVRARLAGTALWGYEKAETGKPLKDRTLAALSGEPLSVEALASSYLPLFMFSGQNAVTYSDVDKLYRVELGARLRNRLAAAQIPAAFTRDDAAWSAYQGTTAVVMWIDPQTLDVRAAQPTTQASFKLAPSAPAPKPAAGGA